MRNAILLILVFLTIAAGAQDFNAKISVNHTQVNARNLQIFSNLEQSLNEFINNKKWADFKINANERINLNMVMNITSYDNVNSFGASLIINASRPVYGSTYSTVLLNHEDNDVKFTYQNFQLMNFNDQTFNDNLTSILGFYLEIVMGMCMDTYSPMGGDPYFSRANNVLIAAQSAGQPGWSSQDGSSNKNRYFLIDDLTSDRFKDMRKAMYIYHHKGLDVMSKNLETGRNEITVALKDIQKVAKVQTNSMWMRVFFNSKVNEIVSIYSTALATDKNKIVEMLTQIDPANATKWLQIKSR
ncbi:MAG: DUF4835 family protein [Bacteroidetes bacterium]|nr:DUF4835 family protein [Bacteroidota bacterium]